MTVTANCSRDSSTIPNSICCAPVNEDDCCSQNICKFPNMSGSNQQH